LRAEWLMLELASDEPEAGPWRAESLTVVAATVMQPGQGKGAGQRPWERADLIVCSTPEISFDPATELVVASPPTRT
jgi:hypothetical protein